MELDQTTCDGIFVAPVGDDGLWEAFRELRAGMRRLGGPGIVRTAFVSAIAPDGRPATGSSDTAVLVAGYRLHAAA